MNTDATMQSNENVEGEEGRYTAGVSWRGDCGYSHNRKIRIRNEVLRGLFSLPCEHAPIFDPTRMGRQIIIRNKIIRNEDLRDENAAKQE